MGFYDQNLKGMDWIPREREKHRNSLIRALDHSRLNLAAGAQDYFRPTTAYLKQVYPSVVPLPYSLLLFCPRFHLNRDCTAQWHPQAHNRHMARQDRFKPLSNYPEHKATESHPAIIGLPTEAENRLLFGSCETNENPCEMQALFGDTEKPAEDVLLDAKVNFQTLAQVSCK